MSSALELSLSNWFRSPVTDREGLAEILKPLLDSMEPVWHPLGFIHVKLIALSSKETFRLHLWSSKSRHDFEQVDKVHDHLFNVSSRVVSGAVTNVRYRFLPDDEGDWRELRVCYGDTLSSLRETGVIGRLTKVESNLYSAPATYKVPRYELHETILSGSSNALTIVKTDSVSNYLPRAIFHRDSLLPAPRLPVRCDKELWLDLLGEMIPI